MTDQQQPTHLWELFFAQNMQRLRELKKMSQTELAKRLKAEGLPFHQQTVQRIENGERPVRLNEAHIISKTFDVNLEAMTSTTIPSTQEMIWSMNILAREAHEGANNNHENYSEWLEKLASFAFTLDDILEKSNGLSFAELPSSAQLGLALCPKILEISQAFKASFEVPWSIVGGPNDETDPDNWGVHENEGFIEDISAWIRIYDCELLRDMSSRSWNSLYAMVFREIHPSGKVNPNGER